MTSQILPRRKGSIRTAVIEAIRLVAAVVITLVVIVAPLYLLVINASKNYTESRTPSFDLPTEWVLFDNLAAVLQNGAALVGFANSVVITSASVAIVLVAGSMAAWVFARSPRGWVRRLYYYAIFGLLVPPPVVTTVMFYQSIGIAGERVALVATMSGAYLAFSLFILTGFIRTIPRELEEAAQIDGANRWVTFWRIVFPLLGSSLFAVGIILFVSIWNDFFYAFFLLDGSDKRTLPLGLFSVVSSNAHDLNWNYVFANVLVVSLPLVVVFFIGQRRILNGVMVGGLK